MDVDPAVADVGPEQMLYELPNELATGFGFTVMVIGSVVPAQKFAVGVTV